MADGASIYGVPGAYDERTRAIVQRAEFLLGQRLPMLNYWQDVAENFLPIRANFTVSRWLGDDFSSNNTTSYPLQISRDLTNNISQMMRPTGQPWFAAKVNADDDQVDRAANAYLEHITATMRRAMYDKAALFTKATKQADGDFANFGQACLSVEINWKAMTLLYRCWHLRDMAWCEGYDGQIDFIVRKWEPTCKEVYDKYGKDNLHKDIVAKVEMDNGRRAYDKCSFLHIVTKNNDPALYGKKKKTPWNSVMVDTQNKFLVTERGELTSVYVIPRWVTPSDSQYAYSAAVLVALPDARLIQAITHTLLKAGEKAVDPPMIAVGEAIRSDIAIYAGGITYADAEYDERLGDVLRPLTQDTKALPTGFNMQMDLREQLKSAFYLDKLSLPPIGHDMTAFETSKRVQEYIQQALPLFEPIEQEYNDAVCSNTFDLLLAANAFGPRSQIPDSLSGSEIKFNFTNPLTEARDQAITQTFIDTKGIIDVAASMDPAMGQIMEVEPALREALRGRGTPTNWLKTEQQMADAKEDQQTQEQLTQAAQIAQGAGSAAQSLGQGTQALGQAAQELGQ